MSVTFALLVFIGVACGGVVQGNADCQLKEFARCNKKVFDFNKEHTSENLIELLCHDIQEFFFKMLSMFFTSFTNNPSIAFPPGFFRNFWVVIRRWDLEPLAYNRAGSAKCCYPMVEFGKGLGWGYCHILDYIGMCRCAGYAFQSVYSRKM